jgi:hypothetical protein
MRNCEAVQYTQFHKGMLGQTKNTDTVVTQDRGSSWRNYKITASRGK